MLAVCPPEINEVGACFANSSWKQSTQVATSIGFSHRSATTVYFQSNSTLAFVENLSASTPYAVSPNDLFFTLNQLFGNIPTGNNSITENFISWLSTYLIIYISQDQVSVPKNVLRQLLTWPIFTFQDNALGNYSILTTEANRGLPMTMSVNWSCGMSKYRLLIARWTVIVFTGIGSGVFALCLAAILSLPGTRHELGVNSFPLLIFGLGIGFWEVIVQNGKRETLDRSHLNRADLVGVRLFGSEEKDGDLSAGRKSEHFWTGFVLFLCVIIVAIVVFLPPYSF